MRIRIYSFGKSKNKELNSIFGDLLSKSNHTGIKVEHIEIIDKDPSKGISVNEIVLKDKKDIKKYFLAEWGKEYSSGEFQNKLSLDLVKFTDIDIYVGNAYGWIKDYINAEYISLSKMVYSHEIAKVLLIEQIYRYMDKISGGKYSK